MRNLSKLLDFFKTFPIMSDNREIKPCENSRDNGHYSDRRKAKGNMTECVVLSRLFGAFGGLNRLNRR